MVLIIPENPLGLRSGSTVVAPVLSDNSTAIVSSAWVKSQAGLSLQAQSAILTSLATASGTGFVKKDSATSVQIASTVSVSEITSFAPEVVKAIGAAVLEPTGFKDQTSSTLTFTNGTRTLSIGPVSGSFSIFYRGTEFVKSTTETLQIANTEGAHFIYYDETGVLVEQFSFDISLIKDKIFVAYIWWDVTNQQALFLGDERHGSRMDSDTHYNMHTSIGSQYVSGFTLSGFTIGNGSLDTHAQLQADAGIFNDEDITFSHTATTSIPILYRSGTAWRKKTADTFPFIQSGSAGFTGASGRMAYNLINAGSGSLAEVGEGGYVLVHYAAANDRTQKVVGFLGISEYYSPFAARNGIGTEITALKAAFPLTEFVFIGSVLFETSTAFANSVRTRVTNFDITPSIYTDLRPQSPKEYKTTESLLGLVGRKQVDQSVTKYIEYFYADFTNNSISTTANAADFQTVVAGAGTAIALTQRNNFDTVISNTTGTSATGSAYWRTNGLVIFNSTKTYEMWAEFDVQWSAASSASQRYTTRVGFFSTAPTAEPTAGIYIRYVDNVNSGLIQCVSRNAGVETVLNSTVAGGTGKAVVQAQLINGANLYFYINGNKVTGSITTNIPLNVGMFFGASIVKSVGTTAILQYTDFINSYVHLYGGR